MWEIVKPEKRKDVGLFEKKTTKTVEQRSVWQGILLRSLEK